MAATNPLYLFAGDSLTEGVYGENYVERVGKALYQGQFGLTGSVVNAGRGGDTVNTLLARLDEPLDRYRPDWVVLEVGTNDVWIPWLANRSLGILLWSRYQRLTKGLKPATDLDQFAALYRRLIDKVDRAGARALVCTATPIGERITSPLNSRLARLNGVIKHVAVDRGAPVADVWQAFVEEYAPLSKPRGRVPGEWLVNWIDRRRLRSTPPDEIAERRRLRLTFDGLHLNSRGADLWALTIVRALARIQPHNAESVPAVKLLNPPPGSNGAL
jgi:lysophospholipase L1-like esterase